MNATRSPICVVTDGASTHSARTAACAIRDTDPITVELAALARFFFYEVIKNNNF